MSRPRRSAIVLVIAATPSTDANPGKPKQAAGTSEKVQLAGEQPAAKGLVQREPGASEEQPHVEAGLKAQQTGPQGPHPAQEPLSPAALAGGKASGSSDSDEDLTDQSGSGTEDSSRSRPQPETGPQAVESREPQGDTHPQGSGSLHAVSVIQHLRAAAAGRCSDELSSAESEELAHLRQHSLVRATEDNRTTARRPSKRQKPSKHSGRPNFLFLLLVPG